MREDPLGLCSLNSRHMCLFVPGQSHSHFSKPGEPGLRRSTNVPFPLHTPCPNNITPPFFQARCLCHFPPLREYSCAKRRPNSGTILRWVTPTCFPESRNGTYDVSCSDWPTPRSAQGHRPASSLPYTISIIWGCGALIECACTACRAVDVYLFCPSQIT